MLPKYSFNTTFGLSEIVAGFFELSAEKGYNSIVVAEQAMNSRHGVETMTAICFKEYSSPLFMLEGYEKYAKLKLGKPIYPRDVMWFAGFLYKYWIITRDMSPQEIYKIAPIQRIYKAFPRLHTQGWEFAIEDLTEGITLNCEVFVPQVGYYGEDMNMDYIPNRGEFSEGR